jgi:hypothetical protein
MWYSQYIPCFPTIIIIIIVVIMTQKYLYIYTYIYISLVAFYPNICMYIYIPQFISKLNPMISYYIILSNLNKILAESHSFFTEKKNVHRDHLFFTQKNSPCLPWGIYHDAWGDKKWNYHGDMSTIWYSYWVWKSGITPNDRHVKIGKMMIFSWLFGFSRPIDGKVFSD